MSIPEGFKLVPVEPTENMVIHGFESAPNECFTDYKVWEAYQEMSGCQQAAFRAKLCWAAMLAAAPTPPQPIYDEAKERKLFESFVVGFHHGAKLTGYVHDDPDYPGLNGQFLYEDWDVQSAWAVWQKCAQSRAKAGEDE